MSNQVEEAFKAVENTEKKKFKTGTELPDDVEKAKEHLKSEFGKRIEAAEINTASIALAQPLRFDVERPEDLRSEEQNVVYLRFAHRKQNPPSDRPAFMICSTFMDPEEADDHYALYKSSYDAGGATWKCETGGFIPCATSIENQLNDQYKLDKKNAIIKNHQKKLAQDRHEFQANIDQQTAGKTGVSIHKKKEAVKEKRTIRNLAVKTVFQKKVKEEGRRVAPSMANDARKNGQHWAVVSFLCDNTTAVLCGNADPEPMIRVYGCFATPEDANEEKLKIAEKIKDYDIDVVATGEWLFPEDLDLEKLKEEYRNEKQNEIMNTRKEKKRELELYERYCNDEKINLPETIVDEEGNVEKKHEAEPIEFVIKEGEKAIVEKDNSIAELQKRLDVEREKLKKAKGETRKQVKEQISEIREKTQMIIEQKKTVRELLKIRKEEALKKSLEPKIETPIVETSIAETSSVETSITETSSVETSSVETPSVEATPIEATAVEIPSVEATPVEIVINDTQVEDGKNGEGY